MSHLSEEEQIAALKDFWDDWGNLILTVALVISAGFAGWRYWQVHQRHHREELSSAFQRVMIDYQHLQAASASDKTSTENTALHADAERLIQMDSASGYADLTRWLLARVAVDHQDYQEARHQLQHVLDHNPESQIAQLTQLRMAAVDIAAGQPAQALRDLQQIKDAAYDASKKELEGDADLANHQPELARAAYQAADQALLRDKLPPRPLLNLKMADLGIAPLQKTTSVAPQGAPAS